jgi:surfactin synthase thioesterase subunit
MKIFFFHHAGGDQYAFKNFKPLVQQHDWKGVYYDHPGHGERFSETLLSDIHQIAHETFESNKEKFTGDFAFFGVSMGTLVSFIVAQKLMAENLSMPKHFFAASRKCPASHRTHPKAAHLDSDDFWRVIANYGGCPPALIEHVELREVYEPIIRADFKALEDYEHLNYPKLKVPATILFGKEDHFKKEELLSWQNHFQDTIEIIDFEGGHFFCYEQAENVMQIVKNRLS